MLVVGLVVMMLIQSQGLSNLKARVTRVERTVHPRVPPGTSGLSPEVEQKVLRLVSSGKKIAATKMVREQTGMGLMEAKDLVDRF